MEFYSYDERDFGYMGEILWRVEENWIGFKSDLFSLKPIFDEEEKTIIREKKGVSDWIIFI